MATQPAIDNLSEGELFRRLANVMSELTKRGFLRTQNNPVGDYAEWLVKERLDMTLADTGKRGYDAIDKDGRHYQVKGRRYGSKNRSRQLGIIRNLKLNEFDFVIAVFLNANFTVAEAYRIPIIVVHKYAKENRPQGGHKLYVTRKLMAEPDVQDITEDFRD